MEQRCRLSEEGLNLYQHKKEREKASLRGGWARPVNHGRTVAVKWDGNVSYQYYHATFIDFVIESQLYENRKIDSMGLTQFQKSAIVGFYRQCQNALIISGIMNIGDEIVETVLQDYFGLKLQKNK